MYKDISTNYSLTFRLCKELLLIYKKTNPEKLGTVHLL